MPVLEEIGGLLGSLVWGSLRSVTAWVDTPLEDRRGMFPADASRRRMAEVLEASPPAIIEGALTDLADLLERPADADPAAVGVACTRIARWADDRVYLHTAAQFYQVAANACLTDPEYALAAARSARDLADYSRAEVWLQRAIGLSRQDGDWEAYTRSYLAYATMMRRRGNIPSARRHVERALRRAVRGGYDHLRAGAYHDLFVIEAQAGNTDIAEGHAQRAAQLYPAGDRRLRQLAQDMAYVWIGRNKPREALAVFDAVLQTTDERSRPYALGGIALASAMIGSVRSHKSARIALSEAGTGPGVAEAWVEVGEGALILGRIDEAKSAANHAQNVACKRKEHRIEFLVDALRGKIASATQVNRVLEQATATAGAEGPLDSFAVELVTALQPA